MWKLSKTTRLLLFIQAIFLLISSLYAWRGEQNLRKLRQQVYELDRLNKMNKEMLRKRCGDD